MYFSTKYFLKNLGKTLSKYFLFFNGKSMLLNMSVAQRGTVFIFPGVHIGSPTSLQRSILWLFFPSGVNKNKPPKNLKIILILDFHKYIRIKWFLFLLLFLFFFSIRGKKKNTSNPSSLPMFPIDCQNYMCTPSNKKSIPPWVANTQKREIPKLG